MLWPRRQGNGDAHRKILMWGKRSPMPPPLNMYLVSRLYAVNPLSGARVPVVVVSTEQELQFNYGSDTVHGVPCHNPAHKQFAMDNNIR